MSLGVWHSWTSVAEWWLPTAAWDLVFSTILFAVVWILTRRLPSRLCRLRHLLWGMVLVRLVLPPTLSVPFSVGRVVTSTASDLGWVLGNAPAGVASVEEARFAQEGDQPRRHASPAAALGVLGPAALLLWVVGIALVGGRLARRRRAFRQAARAATPVDDRHLLQRLEYWRATLGVGRTVRLRMHDSSASPFTIGSLAPTIVVPRLAVESAGRAVMDCAIAHEMVHVKRWDDLLLQVQGVIATLYFFHPIAWLAARRMRDEAEHVCDQAVLSQGGIVPRVYGASVLAFLRMGAGVAPVCGVPAFETTTRQLKRRMQTIMSSRTAPPRSATTWAVAGLLAAFMLPMAANPGGAGPIEGAAPEMQQPEWPTPLPGSWVASQFGPRRHPLTGELASHSGIDLVAPRGTAVHSVAPGVVARVSQDGGRSDRGNWVLIDHGGGYKTHYSHLDSIAVRTDQRLGVGDIIGTVGSTGLATASHLHFEVWQRDVPVDPSRFVKEWQEP